MNQAAAYMAALAASQQLHGQRTSNWSCSQWRQVVATFGTIAQALADTAWDVI